MVSARPDAELLADPDPEAFGAFYDRHLPAVTAYVGRRARRADLTFDVVAETFARALEHRTRYDAARGPAVAWLLGIARNLLVDAARRGRVADAARRRLALAPVVLDDDGLARVEARATVDLKVPRAKLSAPLRTYSFAIFPRLSAGDPSWCMRLRLIGPGPAISAGSGCGPAPVGGSFLTGVGFQSAKTSLAGLLVGPDVAAVRLGTRRRIVPRRDPRLPQPWRAVVAVTAGATAPLPVALDANDQPLPRPPEKLASALRTKKRRLHVLPSNCCALLGGPRPRFIDVAPVRSARPVATVGPAFRACYVATYGIGGRYLQAALLVDATDPDRPAPAFPNAVDAGGAAVHVPGAMLARRAGNAWIVVRAGPPDVRRRLLGELRARLR
jgi:RNA polymerase sigma-70 factor, ECF subfamily